MTKDENKIIAALAVMRVESIVKAHKAEGLALIAIGASTAAQMMSQISVMRNGGAKFIDVVRMISGVKND